MSVIEIQPSLDDLIKPVMGEHYLQRVSSGKTFIHCVVETGIKNPRDWGAHTVHIITVDKDRFIIIDDGDGMNKANRNAFCSLGESTGAEDPTKTAKYGTGSTHFLFSHATRVHVRTAPKESPDLVFEFEFLTGDYQERLLKKQHVVPKIYRKTPETWPHMYEKDEKWHHTTGTEITYFLKNPKSQGVYRGQTLAKMLSERLHPKFEDIVKVDDLGHIPPKIMIGQPFAVTETVPGLGVVDVNLYRPKKKSSEDSLRLASHEVGEATMGSFMTAIAGLKHVRLDPLFTHLELCGTIATAFLAEYSTESREVIDSSIADDTKTILLIRLLNKLAPEIARALQIERDIADNSDNRVQFEQFTGTLNNCYVPEGEMPPGLPGEPPPDNKGKTNKGKKTEVKGPVLRLKCPDEVEIGQTFTVSAIIRKDLQDTYSPTDVQWHHTRTTCTKLVKNNDDGSITLEACKSGTGSIRAEIPGTSYQTLERFNVVPERLFRVYPPTAETFTGQNFNVYAMNPDKLKGQVSWKLDGVGQIEKGPKTVRYIATRPGTARITGFDSENPHHASVCNIRVTAKEIGQRVRIQEWWYDVEFGKYRQPQFMRPVVIMHHEPRSKLFVNVGAPGFEEERKRGRLVDFLLSAAAHEHARHRHMREMEPEELGIMLTTEQLMETTADIASLGYQVYEEIRRAAAKRK